MHILIKDFKGFNTSFEIEPSETIEQIKEKYLKYFNVPKEAQNLLLNEVNLEDNKKIIDYNVNEGTTLELNLNENYIKINARNIMGKIIPFYLRNSDNSIISISPLIIFFLFFKDFIMFLFLFILFYFHYFFYEYQ